MFVKAKRTNLQQRGNSQIEGRSMNPSSNLSGDAYFYNERNAYHSYQNEY